MPNWIEKLKLEAHIEGGYFGLIYRSSDNVISLDEKKPSIERSAGSSIYFLLQKEVFSAFHRLKSDEIWHYYDGGSPIDIYILDNGKLTTCTLGNPRLTPNATFQVVVKAGVWFAAEVRDKSSYGLVGCTVSPAFEYDDFELAVGFREELVMQYPDSVDLIEKFIKPKIASIDHQTCEHDASYNNENLSTLDVDQFKWEKHQSGGFFCVNYKSNEFIRPLDSRYKSDNLTDSSSEDSDIFRVAGTSMYYLLEKQNFSTWQRLNSDEIWHYYDGGSAIVIHIIDENGTLDTQILGNPLLEENASFQVVIKAGNWFAAEVKDKSAGALIGCTSSPGFENVDLVIANTETLRSQYPQHTHVIDKFSHGEKNNMKSIGYAALALEAGLGLYSVSVDNDKVFNIEESLVM